jgi:hypothetical protein
MTSEDADFLDEYIAGGGARTRSGAIRKAIRLLRAASQEEFGFPPPASSPAPSVSTGFRLWRDRSSELAIQFSKVGITIPSDIAAELRARAGQGNMSAFIAHALSEQFRCERLVKQAEPDEKRAKRESAYGDLR